jgi:hypothetical protein
MHDLGERVKGFCRAMLIFGAVIVLTGIILGICAANDLLP